MDAYVVDVIKQLFGYRLDINLLGTAHLLPICCRAAELAAAGEDFIPQRIVAEYAEMKRWTPFAVWARIEYARNKAGIEMGAAELIRQIAWACVYGKDWEDSKLEN